RLAGPALAGGQQVRVRPEREARVRVAEVLGERLDALPRVQEHGGVRVPEGVHAVLRGRLEVPRPALTGRDHAGSDQGSLPGTHVEDAAVVRSALLVEIGR